MSDTPMPETLESLAAKITTLTEVVKGGFAGVDERFTQVDARFAQVDARFAQVDERLAKVDGRLETVDGRLETVEGRLDKSDNRFTQLEASIGRKLDETRAQLEVKIDTVDRKLVETRAQLEVKIDTVDRKLVETRAHLGVKIEAVDTRVTQVYDAVIALTSHNEQNRKDHERFDKTLQDHDLRLLAVQHRAPRNRRKGGLG